MDDLSYDLLIDKLITLRLDADETKWTQGAICATLIDRMRVPASTIANECNCSAAQIRELAKTFRAFPEESMRVPELSWFHHRIAAGTDDPEHWIGLAADQGWSTRELTKAIKGETVKDELREADRVWAKVLRIIDAGGPGGAWLEKQIAEYKKEPAPG
jgi:hypothetical protein